jgi:hypothetical protein
VAGIALAPGESSRWFRLPALGRVGFFFAGPVDGGGGVRIEWASSAGATSIGSAAVATDNPSDTRPDVEYWRFYSAAALPAAPAGARLVRFTYAAGGRPGRPVGLTPPVTYEDERLPVALRRDAPALAVPNLLSYVPCVRQPEVRDSAGMPGAILAFRTTMWPIGSGTSPFDGVTDVYPLVRLPLSDSADPPGEVALYEVDRRLDGAAVLPVTSTRD